MAKPSEAELRERARALLADIHPDRVDRATFRGAQFDRGLAWVHFPEGLGGLGLDPGAQRIVDEELRRGARTSYANLSINPIGIGMAAPTLLAFGSEELKQRFLKRIFTGEDIWCQLFSEPGAGSDVAGLSTRAVRDGDDWVLTGQKVWTSLAHRASFGLLLARSEPDVPKHDGLSYFVLDMKAPGVEVRPLHQITGEAEFNEVFLNGVRIPDRMRLGRPGEGWKVAVTTLMNERVALGGAGGGAGRGGPMDLLLQVWRRLPEPADEAERHRRAVQRDRVTQLWIEARLLALTGQRARSALRAGTPGPEGSVGKLMMAEVHQRIHEACLDLLGDDALVYEPGYELKRPDRYDRSGSDAIKHMFLRSRGFSIEGGTSEIMRNILGERVLGLPGDLRADKGLPWSEVPRN